MRAALPLAFSALLVSTGVAARGQNTAAQAGEKPVFPGQIDLVRLDIVALDASNKPVTDLRQEEIWILENGKKQEIVSFVPITHSIPSTYRAVANDVVGNPRDDGRLIFLVLDDSNSMKKRTAFVKEAATRLVERLNPEDWVGMLFVSQNRQGSLEFTQDHALALRAIRVFAGEQSTVERWFKFDEGHPGPTPLVTGPLPGGATDEPGAGFSMPRPGGQELGSGSGGSLKEMFDAERPLLMVRDVSKHLRNIEARRRALVYIGQGAVRSGGDALLPNAIEAARNANLTVYTIDVSDPATRNARGPTRTEGTRVGELSLVSTSTGGVTSMYSSPTEAADHVVEDTSVYYLTGYSPTPPRPGEPARTLEVRTTRRGVRLLARKTYVPAPKEPPTSPRLEAARSVRDLLPVSDLSLRAFAAPFAGSNQKQHDVAIVVEVTLPETAASRRAAFTENVDLTLVAARPGKGIKASEQSNAHLSLNPEKAQGFGGRYLLCARIAVEAGRYQFRIGARSSAAAKAGSVYLDVLVPDFRADAISLSGLVIGQTAGRDPMPVARRSSLEPILPFVPSLARDFTTKDEAWAFARAYRGKEGDKSEISVEATITNLDDGTTAWTSPGERTLGVGGRSSADYRVALPLSHLALGSYRLRVEAKGAGDSAGPSRELDFRVVGGSSQSR